MGFKVSLVVVAIATSALMGCNDSETSSPSTVPKLGGSSAFNERTSIVMQSSKRAEAAIKSKLGTDSTDPNLDQMIVALQPCTVDIKQVAPPDLTAHEYLLGTCPVDYKKDEIAFNGFKLSR